jgi:UDP-glucose 4-epimerase
VVAKFIRRALSGKILETYGDGHQTRDFIYIEDLIDAVFLAATTKGIGGEAFQIATNVETTIGEMADMLVCELNKQGITHIDMINGEARLGDVRRNFSDTTKAKKRLGWQPHVNLATGIRKTVEYFVNEQIYR